MDSVLSMETDVRTWVEALRSSHDSLVAEVTTLAPEQLGAESYCRGWDVAQVLSHLGSGAEIGLLGLERALVDAPPLEREDLPVIWGRWNALSPAEKASEMVVWDRRFVSVLQGLDNSSLDSLHVELFGRTLTPPRSWPSGSANTRSTAGTWRRPSTPSLRCSLHRSSYW